MGALQIFGTLIQAKHLHSFPGHNPRIEVRDLSQTVISPERLRSCLAEI